MSLESSTASTRSSTTRSSPYIVTGASPIRNRLALSQVSARANPPTTGFRILARSQPRQPADCASRSTAAVEPKRTSATAERSWMIRVIVFCARSSSSPRVAASPSGRSRAGVRRPLTMMRWTAGTHSSISSSVSRRLARRCARRSSMEAIARMSMLPAEMVSQSSSVPYRLIRICSRASSIIAATMRSSASSIRDFPASC